ncbi:RNA polymerase sigma factor SigJ [Paenibacillus glycinis]|uniref:Sigma-70 family RNA polymerase sigma factor n=1 Tax=Paenibacillus glycinis TaxID=2697035 RepID=A0ABW9XRR6_9BACL|nr:RNA polymerase sigma factor SigJ [Paenibacillus glycinis]NBD25251.1 sigma-70 family RNA polymerase sigma factor [Paenibacillus glycinis]
MENEKILITEELYASYKTLLFTLAYRMLGSVMDAEDIVQEAFLSLQGKEAERISNVKAYLCKIATNRCIDRLRSAQRQREVYVGPWLPEPLVADWAGDVEVSAGSGFGSGSLEDDPYQAYARHESVSTAYLLLLQQLSSVERAVFLLREVLQYDYDEIADIVGKSSANCRQIFHRAKRGIQPEEERNSPSAGVPAAPGHQQLVEQFTAALTNGDIGKLLHLLSPGAALLSDGGGKVTAAVNPIIGAARISGFLQGVLKKLDPASLSYRLALVGGQLGLVTYTDGTPSGVFSFRAEQGRIANIYVVVNPDKLTGVT